MKFLLIGLLIGYLARPVIDFLLTRRVSVKPEVPGDKDTAWLVMKGNTIQEFIDDWQRSGPRIAALNVYDLWRVRHKDYANIRPDRP